MRALIITLILLAATAATLISLNFRRRPAWQSITLPTTLKRDGNRANDIYLDQSRNLVGLAATGVVWSPTANFQQTRDGWIITHSAAGHSATLPLTGKGPALIVAVPAQPPERFNLSQAEFDALIAAIRAAPTTADPGAPLDSLSVVDVIRDHLPDTHKPRLLRLLSNYRTIELTPDEKKRWNR